MESDRLLGGVSVWEADEVLEMGTGDGCVTVLMYLMPLNCIHKIVKMANFMLGILSNFKK